MPYADGTIFFLYFRAYGLTYIKNAIGLQLSFSGVDITYQAYNNTVRANVSASTSVTLNATNGIGGGNFIGYTGVNGLIIVLLTKITSVTPDPDGTDSDGVMVVQLATNTNERYFVLAFIDIYKVINFVGTINITQYPTANKTIYLDLDKIITPAVASKINKNANITNILLTIQLNTSVQTSDMAWVSNAQASGILDEPTPFYLVQIVNVQATTF